MQANFVPRCESKIEVYMYNVHPHCLGDSKCQSWSGVSRLWRPRSRQSQSADLTGLIGVKQLMRTPKVQKSPSLGDVKKLVATPKDVAGTLELDGIQNLVKTNARWCFNECAVSMSSTM